MRCTLIVVDQGWMKAHYHCMWDGMRNPTHPLTRSHPAAPNSGTSCVLWWRPNPLPRRVGNGAASADARWGCGGPLGGGACGASVGAHVSMLCLMWRGGGDNVARSTAHILLAVSKGLDSMISTRGQRLFAAPGNVKRAHRPTSRNPGCPPPPALSRREGRQGARATTTF